MATDLSQFWILLLIIFCITILIISLNFYYNYKCEEPEVEYRFVPRTFQQEQREPLKASIFFNNMFSESSVNQYGIPLSLNANRKLAGEVLA